MQEICRSRSSNGACFDILGILDPLKYRALPGTLVGLAQNWYTSIPEGSINSYGQFVKSFTTRFVGDRRTPKTVNLLLTLKQEKGESLWERFNQPSLQIPNLKELVGKAAYI